MRVEVRGDAVKLVKVKGVGRGRGTKPRLAREVLVNGKRAVRLVRKAIRFKKEVVGILIPAGFYEPGEEVEVFLLPGRVMLVRPHKKPKKEPKGEAEEKPED